jgi:hypothetical protein
MTHEKAYLTNSKYRESCDELINAVKNGIITYEEAWGLMREMRNPKYKNSAG